MVRRRDVAPPDPVEAEAVGTFIKKTDRIGNPSAKILFNLMDFIRFALLEFGMDMLSFSSNQVRI
jgi:hypothetical protein